MIRPVSLTLIASLVLGSIVGGCGSSGAATGSTCPTTSTLTYANFGQAFMSAHCTSCHTSQESPSLTTVASIRANSTTIDREAASGPNATNTNMPQDGSVSDADRTKLGEWLACGAP